MATDSSSIPARIALALGLVVAALGVLVQFLVGVPGFPAIPPGPIILGVAAIVVLALPRRRWPLVVGLVAAVFVTGGGLIEGSVWGRLADPATFDVWSGAVLQWSGLLVALISGALAVRLAYRRPGAVR
ncbi:hypothetical protein [Micromonospora mirobrigensis]|uniref:Uncharacterized protein n=1 Tax=Micromonospora mirobrigensis TaxID=262898 RepID=A0A1C4Z458_9ACTN|nr:hypothetical protein [Micromonospora mirobrigensis]SCF27667.1 hypothetical protein GA0070564_10549 [Micromonospora mirobrigensis]